MSRRHARTTAPHMPTNTELIAEHHAHRLGILRDNVAHLLNAVAGLYDDVRNLALHGGAPTGNGDHPGAAPKPASRPPTNVHTLDVLRDVDTFTAWATSRTGRHDGPAPDTLRDIATRRTPRLITDPNDPDDITGALNAHATALRRIAHPDGVRWVPVLVPCAEWANPEHLTTCPGEYRMRLDPNSGTLGNLHCTLNHAHQLTPAQWIAGQRKHPTDRHAAARHALTTRNTHAV